MNASALAESSLMSTPTKRTPAPEKRRASSPSAGASSRHGVHQEPQKFMTTTEPRSADSLNPLPVRVFPVTCGAIGRAPGLNTVVL
jgi:hypothetical protein